MIWLGRCRYRWCLAAVLSALAACGPTRPCQQIESSGQSATSWAATATMVTRRWRAGDLPTSYARNTLTQGEQQIRQAAATLERTSAPAAPAARAARARYERLAAMLARIDEAIGKGNKEEAAGVAAGLPHIEQQISGLRDRCRAQTR